MTFIKYFLIAIIIPLLSACKKPNQETEKIESIQFSYYGGLRIPYNEVIIRMERDPKQTIVFVQSKPLNENPKWEYSKLDTVVFKDVNTFSKFADAVISLDKIDMDKAHTLGLDGYTCTIEYGAKGKNKSYSFWSPTSRTKERGLTEFANLCGQILDVSGLKKQEIIEE